MGPLGGGRALVCGSTRGFGRACAVEFARLGARVTLLARDEAALRRTLLVRVLVPGMRESGYGRIINIVSTSIEQPIRDLGVSNTIRGAVASWAKTLSAELAPDGITVNNILPGAHSGHGI